MLNLKSNIKEIQSRIIYHHIFFSYSTINSPTQKVTFLELGYEKEDEAQNC